MNEEYLKKLHKHLAIPDDYDTWVDSIKGDDSYLRKLHNHLDIEDDYSVWKGQVFVGKINNPKNAEEAVTTIYNMDNLIENEAYNRSDLSKSILDEYFEVPKATPEDEEEETQAAINKVLGGRSLEEAKSSYNKHYQSTTYRWPDGHIVTLGADGKPIWSNIRYGRQEAPLTLSEAIDPQAQSGEGWDIKKSLDFSKEIIKRWGRNPDGSFDLEYGKHKYDLYQKYLNGEDVDMSQIDQNFLHGRIAKEKNSQKEDYLEPLSTDLKEEISQIIHSEGSKDVLPEDRENYDGIFLPVQGKPKYFSSYDDLSSYFFSTETPASMTEARNKRKKELDQTTILREKFLKSKYDNVKTQSEKFKSTYFITNEDTGDLEVKPEFLKDPKLRDEFIENSKILQKDIDDYVDKSERFQSDVGTLKALGLNYNWGYKANLQLEQVFLEGAGIVGSTLEWGKKKLYDDLRLPVAMFTGKILGQPESIRKGGVMNYINFLESRKKNIETTTPGDLKWEEVEFGDNLGRFVKEQLANNIFSVAGGLGLGGVIRTVSKKVAKGQMKKEVGERQIALAKNALMTGFFMAEGGGKLSQMQIDQKNAEKNLEVLKKELEKAETVDQRWVIQKQIDFNEGVKDYSTMDKAFSTIAYGGIATIAERFGSMRYIEDLARLAKGTGVNSFKSMIVNAPGNIIKTGGYIGIETIEEVLTQWGQNLNDIHVLKEDKSIGDGIDADFLASTVITSLALQGPSIGIGSWNMMKGEFQSFKSVKKSRALRDEFIQIKNELTDPDLLPKQRKELEKRASKILDEAAIQDVRSIHDAANLTNKDIFKLFDLNRQSRKVNQEAADIGGSGRTMKKGSWVERKIKKLQKKFEEIQQQREDILGKPSKERNKKLKETFGREATPLETYMYNKFTYEKNLVNGVLGVNLMVFDGDQARDNLVNYLNAKIAEDKMTESDKADILKGYDKGEVATFHGDDIIIFEHNARIQIESNPDLFAKGFAAVSPTHELRHILMRKFGLVKNDDIIEASLQAALDTKMLVQKMYDRGGLKKDVYDKFIERLRIYNDPVYRSKINKEGLDPEELLQVIGDLKRLGYLPKESFSVLYSTKSFLNKLMRAKINMFGGDYARLFDLKTPQDVLRFIDSLNRKIDRDKVQLPPEEEEIQQGVKFSKAASDNVQRIYEEQGEAGAMDIIEQFKPITSKIVERRSEAPNFDRQLLTDEIETGKRGIFDLIREYDPKSGVPLAAFINKYLPARAIEASKRVLGEEFTEDITEKVDIVAEEVTTEVKTKPKKKKVVLAERLGITDKVSKAIENIAPNLDFEGLNFKTLKNEIPEIVGELFGIASKKIENLANLTKKELQSAQMFINKNADLLIAMLPEGATTSGTATGVPNSLLKAFYTKTDRVTMAKTGSKAGLAIQQKRDISKKEFLEEFGIIDGKPIRTDRNISARVLALANLTGKMITNQTVRQNEKVLKITQNAVNKIKDGKSKIMFSKAFINQQLENIKLKLVTNKSSKDRKTVVNYITNDLSQVIPIHQQKNGKWVLPSDTYGPRSTVGTNFYITKDERPIIARKAGNNQLRGKRIFTKEEKKAGKKVYSKSSFDTNKLGFEKGLRRQGAEIIIKGWNETVNGKNGNLLNLRPIAMIIEGSSAATYHVVRMMAPALGVTNIGKIKEREHVLVQNNAGDIIFNALIKDNINLVMPWLLDNYYMVGLNESQNALLGKKVTYDGVKKDHKETMPDIFYENLNKAIDAKDMSLASDPLIRYTVSNIPLNEIDWHDGGTALTYVDKKYGFDGSLSYGNNSKTTIKMVNDILTDFFAKKMTKNQAKKAIESITKIKFSKTIDSSKILNKAVNNAKTIKFSKAAKGITVLDFDDTLATTKSLVKYTTPDGTTGTLNAEQYASTYQDLLEKGYKFDFSEFNKVVDAKLAPLFNKALKLQKKFGSDNMFVLTARPPAAQKAIFDYLNANGLNIPMKNITGLGNSTSEAKALWIADKVGQGYNDFYFADDALQNVQAVKNMLDQFDVKSKVQQAKVKFSKAMNDQFNDILENVTSIESKKRFSAIKARKRGEKKGRFRFFIPPSHEDFVGLLYNFIGRGKEGNKHRDFFEKALIRPLNRAYRELNTAKQSIANDYKSLNKQFSDIKKKLTKKTPDGDFTYQDAIRVYLWDKHGYEVPGLSKTDQKGLVDLVMADKQLQVYAETLNIISKQDKYVKPTETWETGDIRTDLNDATGRVGREQFFTEFFENTDIIFSQENLNKIEAAYGAGMVSAIKDILYRTKTGRNRPSGQNKLVNQFMNYLNGSVASTMFFNIRSAVLQQMSMVNFINFADNNIFKAAKAFANQKQYWADWATIFNSDFMKQRRKGIQTDVNGAELAAAVKGSKNPIRMAIKKLLELGFLPTQIGDNIAIATGGATFYRNRINTYLKQGMTQKEAEAKAWTDFEILAEATQQSARPDMVSQQQASPLGKIILAFQNVTSQFNRLGKKAFLDIKNRRITPGNTTQLQSDMSNLSRIAYYFAIQNLIFYSLQSALFMAMFDDNEEDEKWLKKKERIINGSIDSVLRGTGVWGAAIATVKNMAIKWHEQREKGYNADESAVLMEMLNVSPPLGIKARKLVNAEKTLNYNKKTIEEMETFDIDNPMWSATTSYIEATTNVPLNRLYNKTQNVRESLNSQHDAIERVLMFSGWSKWNLGIKDKKEVKSKKKKEKKRNFGVPALDIKR